MDMVIALSIKRGEACFEIGIHVVIPVNGSRKNNLMIRKLESFMKQICKCERLSAWWRTGGFRRPQ